MAIVYHYKDGEYETEALAQAAVASEAARMENNPTDWMVVKEVTGSDASGWTITSATLTDSEIKNPDSTKTYLCYSEISGEHHMAISSTELTTQYTSMRTVYADYWNLNEITKIDDGTDPQTITTITPTTDMSSYVS